MKIYTDLESWYLDPHSQLCTVLIHIQSIQQARNSFSFMHYYQLLRISLYYSSQDEWSLQLAMRPAALNAMVSPDPRPTLIQGHATPPFICKCTVSARCRNQRTERKKIGIFPFSSPASMPIPNSSSIKQTRPHARKKSNVGENEGFRRVRCHRE